MRPLIEIVLDGTPKGKGRPRFVKSTGHAFTPAATKTYEAALRWAAQEGMAGKPPYSCALEIEIEARMPVPVSWSKKKRADALSGLLLPTSKPDVDNLMKTVDAFNMVVWIDDAQVVKASIRKSYHEKPALLVTVSAVQHQEIHDVFL